MQLHYMCPAYDLQQALQHEEMNINSQHYSITLSCAGVDRRS